MKKLLHIALIAPGGYTNNAFIKAFLDNGFSEYHVFDYQEKIFNSDKEAMRRLLIQEAERLKPDLIFCQIQSSEILDIATFKRLSEVSLTVNYTFDIRTLEQTEWLYNLTSVIDLICFSNQRDVDECNRRGYANTMCIQSSVDMEVYVPGRLWGRPNYAAFIGTNYSNSNMNFPLASQRSEMVNRLIKRYPLTFGVWGLGWEERSMTIPGQEQNIYESSLIGINQNNFFEESYCSDRLWRIMAVGAMCLTSYFPGIEKLFVKGVHLDWWHTLDELEEKVGYYFQNSEEAIKIGRTGMEYVRKRHTWTQRIREIMDTIGSNRLVTRQDTCSKMGAHVIDGVIPQSFDEKYNGRTCDCNKIIYKWEECGCQLKEWQLRAQENI